MPATSEGAWQFGPTRPSFRPTNAVRGPLRLFVCADSSQGARALEAPIAARARRPPVVRLECRGASDVCSDCQSTYDRMDTTAAPPIRLTEFSHGGGCGCKIAPGVLRELIARSSPGLLPQELLVGIETSDDAAVYRLNDRAGDCRHNRFFHAHCRRSVRLRRIAATNALSDVYAMGGNAAVCAGAGRRCRSTGCRWRRSARILAAVRRLAPEPAFRSPADIRSIRSSRSTDWSAIGTVDPRRVKRNVGAMPGRSRWCSASRWASASCGAALKKGNSAPSSTPPMVAQHDAAQHARHRARRHGRRARADRRHRLRPARPPA